MSVPQTFALWKNVLYWRNVTLRPTCTVEAGRTGSLAHRAELLDSC
ncbi:hypothetical protein L618_004000000100 [Rhodococcus rhodochrous J45]|uniref:Uncharacterized protein n=1 Tax=Rhodococcus rhodochrous J45 TaxID=935266 RepID=A0A562DL69_RHORH|nr:hypothetical protein L618_004000000100 [Rhodococcus rhodochrous J45]